MSRSTSEKEREGGGGCYIGKRRVMAGSEVRRYRRAVRSLSRLGPPLSLSRSRSYLGLKKENHYSRQLLPSQPTTLSTRDHPLSAHLPFRALTNSRGVISRVRHASRLYNLDPRIETFTFPANHRRFLLSWGNLLRNPRETSGGARSRS
jgi:hypothetical protein